VHEFSFLSRVALFRSSLREQREALADFWEKAGEVLEGSGVRLRPLPRAWAGLGHNRFSVLFIAVLALLDIPPPRRRLYARLNHCLRVWVTACDNLLDRELRETLLTDLPEGAAVFKSAHTLLVADRVFFLMLRDAEAAGTITRAEAARLVAVSLGALTASGRQEAEEEHAAAARLAPAEVLRQVHERKAGALFTAPLAAPAALGDVAPGARLDWLTRGLRLFGIGVQILDDVNDLAQDLAAGRQNYLASLAAHGRDQAERALLAEAEAGAAGGDGGHLWRRFPKASALAQREALATLERGLTALCRGGLPLSRAERSAFLAGLAAVARHPGLAERLRAR
jgi:hypothetical protein